MPEHRLAKTRTAYDPRDPALTFVRRPPAACRGCGGVHTTIVDGKPAPDGSVCSQPRLGTTIRLRVPQQFIAAGLPAFWP